MKSALGLLGNKVNTSRRVDFKDMHVCLVFLRGIYNIFYVCATRNTFNKKKKFPTVFVLTRLDCTDEEN